MLYAGPSAEGENDILEKGEVVALLGQGNQAGKE
jgi:hypothetical protein